MSISSAIIWNQNFVFSFFELITFKYELVTQNWKKKCLPIELESRKETVHFSILSW